jgi:hypothetical protein
MGEMVDYAAGEAPALLHDAPPLPARGSGTGDTGVGPSRWLAPGRAAAPLRPPLAWIQPLLGLALLPLVLVGAALLARQDWRRTALLLSISFYYLLSESPFIYEWRVVAPMHYGLFAAAGGALAAAAESLRRLRR